MPHGFFYLEMELAHTTRMSTNISLQVSLLSIVSWRRWKKVSLSMDVMWTRKHRPMCLVNMDHYVQKRHIVDMSWIQNCCISQGNILATGIKILLTQCVWQKWNNQESEYTAQKYGNSILKSCWTIKCAKHFSLTEAFRRYIYIFCPEDKDSVFLWNCGHPPNFKVWHPRRE